MNRTLASLHGGSLKITLTVPLNDKNVQGVGSYEDYYNPQSPVQEYYSPQTPIQEYYSPQSPVQKYYSSQEPVEDYGPVITADNYKPVRTSQNYPQGWTGHLESSSGGAESTSGGAEPVYKYHVKAGQEPTLPENTSSKKKTGKYFLKIFLNKKCQQRN